MWALVADVCVASSNQDTHREPISHLFVAQKIFYQDSHHLSLTGVRAGRCRRIQQWHCMYVTHATHLSVVCGRSAHEKGVCIAVAQVGARGGVAGIGGVRRAGSFTSAVRVHGHQHNEMSVSLRLRTQFVRHRDRQGCSAHQW